MGYPAISPETRARVLAFQATLIEFQQTIASCPASQDASFDFFLKELLGHLEFVEILAAIADLNDLSSELAAGVENPVSFTRLFERAFLGQVSTPAPRLDARAARRGRPATKPRLAKARAFQRRVNEIVRAGDHLDPAKGEMVMETLVRSLVEPVGPQVEALEQIADVMTWIDEVALGADDRPTRERLFERAFGPRPDWNAVRGRRAPRARSRSARAPRSRRQRSRPPDDGCGDGDAPAGPEPAPELPPETPGVELRQLEGLIVRLRRPIAPDPAALRATFVRFVAALARADGANPAAMPGAGGGP